MLCKSRILTTLLAAVVLAAGRPVFGADAKARDVRRDATVRAVARILPSVVNISTRTQRTRQGYFYNWWQDNWAPFLQQLPPQQSAGSGVIIDAAGYVLTNAHVIQGADEIWVKLADGRKFKARVIAEAKGPDVALLRLQTNNGDHFVPARFAKSGDTLLGETVLALGNPFGLGISVTRGILSSRSRKVTDGDPSTSGSIPDWLQTDAAINPGNSGGPLIDLRGEVIGINVALYRGGQGIGFAMPIGAVCQAISRVYTPEKLGSLWFGARLSAEQGPLSVWKVVPKSPAAKAGVSAGDVVLSLNGHPAGSFIQFTRALVAAGAHPVHLVVVRGDHHRNITVHLTPLDRFFNATLVERKTGLSVQPLTENLSNALGLSVTGGLVISDVEPGSPAAAAGLKPNMVIAAVDGTPVSDVLTAARLLFQKSKGQTAVLDLVIEEHQGFFFRRQTVQIKVKVR